MRGILTITSLTFHEAWRRWVVLIGLALSGIFLVMYAYGFSLIINNAQNGVPIPAPLRVQAYNFLLLAGLYVVHGLTVMLSIFASVDAVSGEINSHTIQSIVTKPIFRWQVILGKWLGYGAMIVLYVSLLSGGVLLVTNWQVGYVPSHWLEAIGLLCLEALVLLSLSILGGTRLATLPNGIALVMFYGVTFIGTWVEQIGTLLQVDTAVRLGRAASFLLPVEALWRQAAFILQPTSGITANFLSPFAALSTPSPILVPYAAIYGAVALVLALIAFTRRDL
jgi:Cu-processing system permease protein